MKTFLSRKSFLFILLMLPFLFFVTCKKGEKIEIRTEEGVIVVINPKEPAPPRGLPTALSIKEDLVLGARAESEESMLAMPVAVDADASGNIYVLDRKAAQIKVFDPQGKFIRAIGRQGQGPGEFQGPLYFQITSGNNIVVTDVALRRVSLLGLDGQLFRNLSAGKMWMLTQAKMDDSGNIVGSHTVMDQEPRTELVRFNAELEPLHTIASVPIARNQVFNPYFPRIIFDLTPEGNVVWGITTEYEFRVVNREGKTVKRIVKKYEPEILTKADRDKRAKELWGEEGPSADMKVEWPEHFPPVQDFILDDRGWLFVRPFVKERQAQGVLYDVFDAEARYVARVLLPAVARRIKAGKLYTIEEDAEGLLQVKRYSMEWK
ncbi:MAG: 6-bladed beta-propeller [Candidatus Saccharicenans sp.]|nr:6-bladed beta-propeller [Candidatus Saccharicenans sp.]MDH7574752.1 6-bladed beta-propeller [Candidatus Saccharicenans sp.]